MDEQIIISELQDLLEEKNQLFYFHIIGVHILWCWGIGTANNTDRKVAYFYERKLLQPRAVDVHLP